MRKEDKLNYRLINRFLGVFLPLILIYLFTNIFNDLSIIPFMLRLLDVLSPIFIALIITWILNPLVKFLRSKDIRNGLATFIAFFVFFLFVYLLFNLFIPVVVKQIAEFVDYIPTIQNSIEKFASDTLKNLAESNSAIDYEVIEEQFVSTMSNLAAYIGDYASSVYSGVVEIFSGLISALFNLFFAIMISFYLLYDYDRVMASIVKMFPERFRNSASFMLDEFTLIVGNYIRSYSVISLIVSLLVYIAFSLQGLSSPLVLAIIVGVFNFIPMIGPFIGAIPAMLVSLSLGLWSAVVTMIVITVVQQIDANILKPLLMGRSTNLHPLIIVISVMVFGKFFGVVGILVAIPITAFLKSIINYAISKGFSLKKIYKL